MGGTLGTHSIGWQPGAGYGAGALAHVAHPTSLSVFQGDVWFPSGHGTGYAVAYYNDNVGPGIWFGFEPLTYNGSGFATADLASASFEWHLVGGTSQQGPFFDTIAGFPNRVTGAGGGPAGDAGGTNVGIMMGCEGQPYYFDNLRLADAVDQTVYDFEGATSASRLGWSIRGKKVNYQSLKVPYGQKLWVAGDSYDPAARTFIAGQGTLYQQAFGSGLRKIATGTYDTRRYVTKKVRPTRQTTYFFNTPGNDTYDSSDATALTVRVVGDLKAGLNTLQLHPGGRVVLSGRLLPGNKGTRVSLQQRKGGWKTVDTTRSGRKGTFSVGVTARRLGKLQVRLRVADGGGNIGFLTIPQTVQVKARAKPKPPPRNISPEGPPPEQEQHYPPAPSRGTTVKAPGALHLGPLVTPALPTPAPPPTCIWLGAGQPAPCLPGRD